MVDPFPAGAVLYAEDLAEWSDQIDSNTAPGWTNFTPSWANTSTAPAIGNGSWTGSRYRRSAGSDIVHFQIRLTWGSTTTAGTGSFWTFGFPPVTPDGVDLADFQGISWLEDVSAGARRFWHAFVFSGGILVTPEAGTGFATVGVPWTWATGDFVRIRGLYRPA